jgi:hypothetical protein
MGAYCIHTPLKGNKMVPWRLLTANFNLTNGQFGVIWYNNLMAGTFEERGAGE